MSIRKGRILLGPVIATLCFFMRCFFVWKKCGETTETRPRRDYICTPLHRRDDHLISKAVLYKSKWRRRPALYAASHSIAYYACWRACVALRRYCIRSTHEDGVLHCMRVSFITFFHGRLLMRAIGAWTPKWLDVLLLLTLILRMSSLGRAYCP